MWRIAIDEPNSFAIESPGSVEEALTLWRTRGPDAAYLAGGCDLIDALKNQWHNPRTLINLKGIPNIGGVQAGGGTVTIGALTTLSALARDPVLEERLSAIPLAAQSVATPQIRNRGTLGGNLLQDSRCPYYRGPWHCYRAGGIVCDAHHGVNLEHAIFGASRCYTVTPSDLAPVMVALDAVAEVSTAAGRRELAAAELFVAPDEDIRHMHRLHDGEILTALRLPAPAGQRSAYVKYTERNVWDFGLVTCAAAATLNGATVGDCRIVLGAVAAIPWRCGAAEDVLRGNRLDAATIDAAARAAAEGAEPLEWNRYKVPLVRKAVTQALTEMTT